MSQHEYDALVKGALLHDVGKLVQRATGSPQTHGEAGAAFVQPFLDASEDSQVILNCIRYHHKDDLAKADLAADDMAYLVCAADQIAAGVQTPRPVEGADAGFAPARPLHSVFSAFGGSVSTAFASYAPTKLNERDRFNYPLPDRADVTRADYEALAASLKQKLSQGKVSSFTCNELLSIYEDAGTYIPAHTDEGDLSDISLFIHSKITAGIAASMAAYFATQGETNYRDRCFTDSTSFCEEDAFLLTSGDLSGIQDFIYTIPTKGALKSLRGRSFYLEILMEQIIDCLLDSLDLTRANLLYSGGGHFYALLPNTEAAQQSVSALQTAVNTWLLQYMGTRLYLALGTATCKANDLLHADAQRSVFARTSQAVGKDKIHRYTPDILRDLFDETSSLNTIADATRECAICHTSSAKLQPYGDTDGAGQTTEACPLCAGLYHLGNSLVSYEDTCFVIATGKADPAYASVPMYAADEAAVYVLPVTELEGFAKTHTIVRLYGKNKGLSGTHVSQRLWIADYSCRDHYGAILDFADLARVSADEKGQGIQRVAVLRADVDNLGAAFIGGFVSDDRENRNRYASLARYADLSRELSFFFKVGVNKIARGDITGQGGYAPEPFSIWHKPDRASRAVHVIYSGGDDVFIVGAWTDILELAVDIRRAFRVYTQGKLTFSAGIAFFSPSYPIHSMAGLTGDLESMAKKNPQKDSVALFGIDSNNQGTQLLCHHIHKWDRFAEGVCREKLQFLKDVFNLQGDGENGLPVGHTKLYQIKTYVEQIDNDAHKGTHKINIARLLYLLARLQPAKQRDKDVYEHQLSLYNAMTQTLYAWIKDDKDRKELLTALHLAIYYMRNNQGI